MRGVNVRSGSVSLKNACYRRPVSTVGAEPRRKRAHLEESRCIGPLLDINFQSHGEVIPEERRQVLWVGNLGLGGSVRNQIQSL